MATAAVALTEPEKQALSNQLVRVIAQFSQLVGTEVNWIQLAADSIIETFQAKGVDGDGGIWPGEIDGLIEPFLTPQSRGKSYTVARRVFFELGWFLQDRSSILLQDATAVSSEPVPSDETHEFAVVPWAKLQEGDFTVEDLYTKAEALKLLSVISNCNPDRHLIVARPKHESWKAVNFAEV